MILKVIYHTKKILLTHLRMFFYGIYNTLIIGDIRVLLSCTISRRLPVGTRLPHPIGIVIGKPPGTKIGKNCIIMQNVTIGVRSLGDTKGPNIGNNVFIGAGAVIVGDISIADGAFIPANSTITKDIS